MFVLFFFFFVCSISFISLYVETIFDFPRKLRMDDGHEDAMISEMLLGMPVGAFLVKRSNANTLIDILRQQALLKKMKNVTPYCPPSVQNETAAGVREEGACGENAQQLLAVHVAGVISESLKTTLIPSRAEAYIPWHRVRSNGDTRTKHTTESDTKMNHSASPAVARFTFVELFAGIGMFRLGLERIGGRCVFSSEIAPVARKVYAKHFGEEPNGDITEYPSDLVPNHDILTAGFPCQSFSKAGSATGLESSKGQLLFEVLRILHDKQPRGFLLENVANLVTMEDGSTMKIVLKSLQLCGYVVSYSVINSSYFVPQDRQRVYIVGKRTDLIDTSLGLNATGDFRWASVTALQACSGVGSDMKLQSTTGGGRKRLREVINLNGENDDVGLRLTQTQLKAVRDSPRFQTNPAWRLASLDGLARTVMGSYKSSFQLYSEFVDIASNEGDNTATKSSAHDPIVAPGAGTPVLRFYSVRECARLQGIPDDFSFDVDGVHHNGAYRVIGNAVCPAVIEAVGSVLADWLGLP